jgi:hypothetical protein
MKKNLLILSIMVFYAFVNVALGQQSPDNIIIGRLVRVSPKLTDIPISLAEVKTSPKEEETDPHELREKINKRVKFNVENLNAKSVDEALQKNINTNLTPPNPQALISSFDGGVSADNVALFGSTVAPPDPTLCVGPNHVVQMVNNVNKIYNKSGTLLAGPFKFSAIAGTATDDGDPIALYDNIADRYILLQFSSLFTNGSESLIFCISQTNDPTGAYYVYEFRTPGFFPDYPHVGIWNNCYVVTTHNFNTAGTAYLGQGYWAFDRTKMANGEPTTTAIGFNDLNAGGNLPVSFEGLKTPDPTSPPTFITYDADEFGGADRLQLRTLTPNFSNPAASVLSAVTNIPVAAFDGRSPNPVAIEQVGTTSNLDQLADRMMSRVIYRRFDTYESLVMNYIVNVSGSNPLDATTYQAAPRWYELTRTNSSSPWTVNQQSTYSPTAISGTTGVNRWMSCPAIDQKGNMSIGYSRSSSANFPDIYYAERRKSDPLSTFGVEQVFHPSAGSQVGTSGRWGDYSAMTIDPSDEETHWYTAEYYSTTTSFSFKTRIGSFKVNDPITTITTHFQKGGTITRQKESLTPSVGPPGFPFKDYPITVMIDNAPTQNANLTLTKTGTATEGVDYDILNASALVLNAGNLSQNFTLRVYDNAIGEPDEFVDLAYTLNANGGNAVAGLYNQQHRITIIGKTVCPTVNVTVTRPTTFCQGDSVIFDANTASGYTHQWYKDNVLISGATQPQYIAKTSGGYRVEITSGGCSISSSSVPVTVNPVIVPTVAAYSVCQNAAVPSGEGLVVPATFTSTINGSIVSGPTYVRGLGNNVTTYTASRPVFFQTYTFVAPTSGPQTFATTAAALTPGTADDTYLTLYQTAFTPATPATNFLRGDDDSGPGFLSSLTHTLVAGTTYIVVVSTFSTGATGTFTLSSTANVFAGGTNQWFTAASSGSSIFTGEVFNPVGVAGSGIPNTATVGATTFYVATSTVPTCRTPVTFTIGNSVGGSVTADATVCTGSNAGTLTLAGHTGAILRWESSTDNFVTPVPIANTTTTLNYTNVTQTTKYRAVVKFAACPTEANSTPATITVSIATVGGSVTADATVCSGSNSGTLTLAGHTGSVLRWESSTDNFLSPPVPIANTTTTQNYTNLTQTTKYRAVVQNGSCGTANSSPATITVNSGTVAGAVSADATVCSGSNTGTLNLAGHTGTILRWESSIDNFVTPVVIANTTTSQAYLNLTQTTKFRTVVQNVSCTPANSTPATITVSTSVVVAGSVTSDASVCAGTNAGTLTLSGHLGTVVSWESSVDNFTTVVAIANTTTTQNYSNLTQTTKFRAIVQGTPCGVATLPVGQGYSSAATITVNPIPIATASADQTICVGSSASLTATCVLRTVMTTLSGTSEVPANASTATGSVTGTFNTATNQLNLTVMFNGLTANASAGHIHNAAVGVNGPVIIPFTVPASTSATFNYSGVLTASQATALLAGNTYVNIHNSSFPGGEVRGQLSVACVANTYVWNPGALSGQTVSVSPLLTTTYTLTASNSTTTCSSTATTIVTVLTPAAPVATGASIVLGGSVTLTATGCTGSGFVLKWYETVGDVAVTMPVSPTADKQYYAKCEQTVGAVVCLSPKSNDVTVTVTVPGATVVFVNQANAAAPIQNGLTWATAYSNLQTALAAAPTGTEIWVAQGTYKPTSTISKTISFSIPSGAVVYGGFVGTETLLSQRNFNTNQTILSGEIGTIANPQDNSFHVVLFNAANNTTRLDGFTIKDGNSNYTVPTNPVFPSSALLPVSVNDGGGIALDNGSSPMIANCKIINNKGNFGGGVFATNGSSPTFMNCMIMGNQSTFGGGAYHLGSNAVYKNVLFSGNKATGGAVYNNVSSPTFTNVTIAGNGGYNGAVFNSSSSPVIKNSIIFGNILPFNDTQSITTNSIVEGGYPGIGNLNLNPQFVSMTPSGLSPTLAGDNSVINTSPAIDGGDNGTITLTDKDLIGNLRRFNGGIVDMGAYEFQGNRVGVLVISIKTGNWEDGTTWDVGRQPLAGDSVIINDNHNVTVNNTGTSKDVKFKTNAKIIYSLTFSKSQLGY